MIPTRTLNLLILLMSFFLLSCARGRIGQYAIGPRVDCSFAAMAAHYGEESGPVRNRALRAIDEGRTSCAPISGSGGPAINSPQTGNTPPPGQSGNQSPGNQPPGNSGNPPVAGTPPGAGSSSPPGSASPPASSGPVAPSSPPSQPTPVAEFWANVPLWSIASQLVPSSPASILPDLHFARQPAWLYHTSGISRLVAASSRGMAGIIQGLNWDAGRASYLVLRAGTVETVTHAQLNSHMGGHLPQTTTDNSSLLVNGAVGRHCVASRGSVGGFALEWASAAGLFSVYCAPRGYGIRMNVSISVLEAQYNTQIPPEWGTAHHWWVNGSIMEYCRKSFAGASGGFAQEWSSSTWMATIVCL